MNQALQNSFVRFPDYRLLDAKSRWVAGIGYAINASSVYSIAIAFNEILWPHYRPPGAYLVAILGIPIGVLAAFFSFVTIWSLSSIVRARAYADAKNAARQLFLSAGFSAVNCFLLVFLGSRLLFFSDLIGLKYTGAGVIAYGIINLLFLLPTARIHARLFNMTIAANQQS